MKTQNRTTAILSLVLALALIPALVFGQPIPNGPKEAPKVAAPPKIPKDAPKAPKVAEQPKVPEAPKVPKVPQVVQQPKVPKAPNVPKVPQVVQQPKVPNAPKVPKVPQVVQQPKVPNAPKIPQNIELPKAPKTPVVAKIPAVKEPPKAPNIVKVQDAPKLPNSPAVAKIPDAPKVPKNPVLTKIPDAPIVPKSKPMIGKVPDAPKVPKPSIISAAKDPKIPNTSGLIVKKIVEVPQTPGSNTGNNSATEATVQEAAAIISGNLRKTDPGGPEADLPGIDRSVKALTGVPVADEGSGNALADSISLLQGTGSLGSPTLPDTTKNNKPPADQGFAEKPTTVDQGTVQGITGNPLNALNPGSVGGPAAADAQNSGGQGLTGIAAQGKGGISDGDTDLRFMTPKGKQPVLLDASTKGAQPVKVGNENHHDALIFRDGSTLRPISDRFSVVQQDTKDSLVTQLYDEGVLVFETIEIKLAPIVTKDTPPAATPTAGRPSEDAVDVEALAKFLREHPALAKQIAASKSGGPGNINYGNADNSTTSGPSNGMAPPAPGTTSLNLVGNPGGRGGFGATDSGSGASSGGLDFNNQNNGAITPTQDGDVTAGNQQEGEAEFFDDQQTRQNFPDGTSAPTNDSEKPPTDSSALTKFLRENPEIAKQIVASSLVQVPKVPVKKK